jgi:hypothetical protein
MDNTVVAEGEPGIPYARGFIASSVDGQNVASGSSSRRHTRAATVELVDVAESWARHGWTVIYDRWVRADRMFWKEFILSERWRWTRD